MGWPWRYAERPLPDGSFVTVYTDITERKRAESRLQLADLVFANSPTAIVIADESQRRFGQPCLHGHHGPRELNCSACPRTVSCWPAPGAIWADCTTPWREMEPGTVKRKSTARMANRSSPALGVTRVNDRPPAQPPTTSG